MSGKSVAPLRVRLNIAIPALLVTITVSYGQICKAIAEHFLLTPEFAGSREHMLVLLKHLETLLYAGAVVAGVVGILLANVVTGPLSRMARQFESLAREGRAEALDDRLGNEFGQLFSAFNRMADSLTRYLPEKARQIFHSIASGVLAVDHRGVLTNINAAADKTLELGGVGINNRSVEEFFTRFGDMSSLVDVLRDAYLNGKSVQGREITVRTVSGEKKVLAVTAVVSDPHPEGGYNLVATFIDLGKVEALDAKMQHQDKLSAVGTLASGVAHEIRNPLASLRGMAQLLRDGPGKENPTVQRYAQVIMEEVDRLNAVVSQLLDFARPTQGRKVPTDVNTLLRKAIGLSKPRVLARNSRLEIELEEPAPRCLTVPDKLMQVFLNLLINAAEAVEENGMIRVESRRVGEGMRITIHNSGSYIPPEVQSRIFEPFFTTKDRGTGLGLAVSYQIVNAHGGTLVVESSPETGTRFYCTLPMTTETVENLPEGERIAEPDPVSA